MRAIELRCVELFIVMQFVVGVLHAGGVLLYSIGHLLCRRVELLCRGVKLQCSGGGWQHSSAGPDACTRALGLRTVPV